MKAVQLASCALLGVVACAANPSSGSGSASGGGSGSGGGSASGGGNGSASASGSGVGSGSGAGGGVSACPKFADGVSAGNVENANLKETSGVVESHKTPGVLWLHNDSGDSPRVFAAKTSGADLGIYSFAGAAAIDWEDIAIGPGPAPGESYLYIGDIGDNQAARANIQLYRVAEPSVDPAAGPKTVTLSGVEKFVLMYPDGAHNAETLMVDPKTSDVFLVTKVKNGLSIVFRAAAPLSSAGPITLEKVGSLDFGAAPLSGTTTTGGEISAAGDWIGIRTYPSAFLWRRAADQTVAEALAGEPCAIPLHAEPQGEAFGFAANGTGYYSTSEGANQPLYFYKKQ